MDFLKTMKQERFLFHTNTEVSTMTYIETLGAKAKAAEHAVASASAKLKN